MIRAEVAYHFADKDAEGRLIFNDDDCTAGPAARLIKAILQLGGPMAERDPAIAGAAAQFFTLINSRPNSPSQSEIETVIADAVHIVPATSLTWDPIVLEVVAAVDAWEEAVSPDGPEEAAAVKAKRANISRRLHDACGAGSQDHGLTLSRVQSFSSYR